MIFFNVHYLIRPTLRSVGGFFSVYLQPTITHTTNTLCAKSLYIAEDSYNP